MTIWPYICRQKATPTVLIWGSTVLRSCCWWERRYFFFQKKMQPERIKEWKTIDGDKNSSKKILVIRWDVRRKQKKNDGRKNAIYNFLITFWEPHLCSVPKLLQNGRFYSQNWCCRAAKLDECENIFYQLNGQHMKTLGTKFQL